MNPIPLTVFATLAGLSLASLALLTRSQDNQNKADIRKAKSYLFLSFLFSILGLLGSAILGNIGQLSCIPTDTKNYVHTVDNIFTLVFLIFTSAFIWCGGGAIISRGSSVAKNTCEKYGYILLWIIALPIGLYFFGIQYFLWSLTYLLLVIIFKLLRHIYHLNNFIKDKLGWFLVFYEINWLFGKFINLLGRAIGKVASILLREKF